MTNDIVALIEYYEKEKGIDRDKVVAALEFAFISAYRKMVPGADAIETLRADVDLRKGETRIFASLNVVADEDHTDKFNQVPLSTAVKKNPEAQPSDVQEFNVTPKDFGRIAVQTAKQTMMQRLRQAEKEMIYEEFKDRAGDVVGRRTRSRPRVEGCRGIDGEVAGREHSAIPGHPRGTNVFVDLADRALIGHQPRLSRGVANTTRS